MDPIAHTLVGGALAASGLGRRTPLATATLLIGANLPDVDVAAYGWGEAVALEIRRGWTHGVLALVALPAVLTGLMLLWEHAVRRARRPEAPPVRPVALLALAALAVLTHPLLDLLNVYGVRLLMPFDDRWFYGDVLFIVDPWLWAILVVGLSLTRRRGSPRPARLALLGLGAYVGAMAVGALGARHRALGAVPPGETVTRAMVGPEPVTPFRRRVVLDLGSGYRVGRFNWLADPPVRYDALAELPRGAGHPALARLHESAEARRFLSWARFPFFQVLQAAPTASGYRVGVIDARYALEPDAPFGALTVEVPR